MRFDFVYRRAAQSCVCANNAANTILIIFASQIDVVTMVQAGAGAAANTGTSDARRPAPSTLIEFVAF